MKFEGVITEYNGRGFKSSPTVFMIKDSIYTIPRSNIEMQLYVGDTIKKVKGEHSYYLKRTSFSQNMTGKNRDTIAFACP